MVTVSNWCRSLLGDARTIPRFKQNGCFVLLNSQVICRCWVFFRNGVDFSKFILCMCFKLSLQKNVFALYLYRDGNLFSCTARMFFLLVTDFSALRNLKNFYLIACNVYKSLNHRAAHGRVLNKIFPRAKQHAWLVAICFCRIVTIRPHITDNYFFRFIYNNKKSVKMSTKMT